jgi:hypothetical protein
VICVQDTYDPYAPIHEHYTRVRRSNPIEDVKAALLLYASFPSLPLHLYPLGLAIYPRYNLRAKAGRTCQAVPEPIMVTA